MSEYRGFTDEELRSALALQQDKVKRLQESPVSKEYKETRAQRIVTVNRIIGKIKAEISSRK
jgi:hypothetical protein